MNSTLQHEHPSAWSLPTSVPGRLARNSSVEQNRTKGPIGQKSAGERAVWRSGPLRTQRPDVDAVSLLDPRTTTGLSALVESPSQPLDSRTRAFADRRFGHDFGQVRIHSDKNAAAAARAINAVAFTVGRHISFSARAYAPQTLEGRSLLAHELTHVLQQRNVVLPQEVTLSPQYGADENRANDAAKAINLPTSLSKPLGRGIIQRKNAVLQRQVSQKVSAPTEPGGHRVVLPALRALSSKERIRLLALLGRYAGSRLEDIGLLAAAYAYARILKLAIGVGLSASAAAIFRLSGGIGIYFGPNGEIGEFKSLGFGAGLALGISAGKQVIVMRDLNKFDGAAYAATVGLPVKAGLGAGVSLIYSPDKRHFWGVSGNVAIGIGIAELVEEWSETSLAPVASGAQ